MISQKILYGISNWDMKQIQTLIHLLTLQDLEDGDTRDLSLNIVDRYSLTHRHNHHHQGHWSGIERLELGTMIYLHIYISLRYMRYMSFKYHNHHHQPPGTLEWHWTTWVGRDFRPLAKKFSFCPSKKTSASTTSEFRYVKMQIWCQGPHQWKIMHHICQSLDDQRLDLPGKHHPGNWSIIHPQTDLHTYPPILNKSPSHKLIYIPIIHQYETNHPPRQRTLVEKASRTL